MPDPTPVPRDLLARRIRVALGQEPGDLLLTGGRVVNVFTRTVEEADVVIADGVIAGVGRYAWEAAETIDLAGRDVIPGLIDTHMHLESTLLTPAELARVIVPLGTTAVISDSHEIGNVLGVAGIDRLARAAEGLPLDVFFMASSCVPATAFEDAGATIGRRAGPRTSRPPPRPGPGRGDGRPRRPERRGGHPRQGRRDPRAEAGRRRPRAEPRPAGLDGLRRGRDPLGPRVDHRGRGPRQGGPGDARPGPRRVAGAEPRRLAPPAGLGPDRRVLVPRHRRHLPRRPPPPRPPRRDAPPPRRRRGPPRGRRPPRRVHPRPPLRPPRPGGGRAGLPRRPRRRRRPGRLHGPLGPQGRGVVARDGTYLADHPTPALAHREHDPPRPDRRIGLPPPPGRLATPRSGSSPTRSSPGSRRSRSRSRPAHWAFDPARDVALVASIERHRGTGKIGLGLVAGFGFARPGAIGSSVAHDSHNLIVAGTDPRSLLACVRALAESGGGFVAALDGQVEALLPLPLAGLISLEDADTVCAQLDAVHRVARALGCPLAAPFGTLSFLALPVIPELRITARGLFDVRTQRFLTD